ncbi:hypothetical protein [Deinococcus detaillensis]|uniref:hypothetical protein n=1 Tax=Deinococcus detaillensis TaxID=2592048 RepID=UPI001CDC3DC7|nr:hypothetical protein [Deinococcus detaillensis]
MSASEVHAGLKRLKHARLVKRDGLPCPLGGPWGAPVRRAVLLPAERGELTRGLPTAYAAPPLNAFIVQGDDPPPVWPDPDGPVRGQAFTPLYRSAPFAAWQDSGLYEWPALVDALRGGSTRERHLASELLEERLLTPVNS